MGGLVLSREIILASKAEQVLFRYTLIDANSDTLLPTIGLIRSKHAPATYEGLFSDDRMRLSNAVFRGCSTQLSGYDIASRFLGAIKRFICNSNKVVWR